MSGAAVALVTFHIAALFAVSSSLCCNSDYKVTPVGMASVISEGPFWDEDSQLLFFVDMKKNILNSYDPVTDSQVRVEIDSSRSPVTYMVRIKGTRHHWIVGLKGSLAVVKWDGKSTDFLTPEHFVDVEAPDCTLRINEAKCDPSNRLWTGSMGKQIASNPNNFERNKGSLYLITKDGKHIKKEEGFTISNGMDWNLQADKMYFIDSFAYVMYEYDFNNTDGYISNQRVLYDFRSHGLVDAMNALPDGMTVDQEGYLWVTLYGTQKVVRIDRKTKQKVFEVFIPKALEITSVVFGGQDMDIMFVTVGRVDWSEELQRKYPDSGRLFMVKGLGVKGTKSRDCDLDKSLWEKV